MVYRFGKREYDLGARTYVMGVLNVTPDSFSDGGKYLDPNAAVDRALAMIEEGADFIDIGGESTRPRSAAYGEGADPVPADEELRRVIPVIERLAECTDVPLSIDTYKSLVAQRALQAGASIVNDISGLHFDAAMAEVVAGACASLVLMHIKGTPKTMQANPVYENLFGEIIEYLSEGIMRARQAGVEQIIVDPGIGFGKTVEHNLQILGGVKRFLGLGYPVLIGASRKSFIGTILNVPIEDRLEGSLAAAVAAALNGASIIRAHDVRATKRAVAVADAIKQSSVSTFSQSEAAT